MIIFINGQPIPNPYFHAMVFMRVCMYNCTYAQSIIEAYVTGFAKRGLIHASDFATLMSHNFVCD